MKSRVVQQFDVNRVPSKPKKRKRKITLVFDEEKRREFVGGFRKRKLERRKKAEEALKLRLKEEKKRLKQSARERFKTLLSQRDVPELEELLSKHEYEVEGGRSVSILEFDLADMTKKNAMIGENQASEEEDEESEQEEIGGEDSDGVEGMELKEKKVKEESKTKKKSKLDIRTFSSKLELKRSLKQAALQQLKLSKAYRQKQRIERVKNKKRSKKEQVTTEKREKRLAKKGIKVKKRDKKSNNSKRINPKTKK